MRMLIGVSCDRLASLSPSGRTRRPLHCWRDQKEKERERRRCISWIRSTARSLSRLIMRHLQASIGISISICTSEIRRPREKKPPGQSTGGKHHTNGAGENKIFTRYCSPYMCGWAITSISMAFFCVGNETFSRPAGLTVLYVEFVWRDLSQFCMYVQYSTVTLELCGITQLCRYKMNHFLLLVPRGFVWKRSITVQLVDGRLWLSAYRPAHLLVYIQRTNNHAIPIIQTGLLIN